VYVRVSIDVNDGQKSTINDHGNTLQFNKRVSEESEIYNIEWKIVGITFFVLKKCKKINLKTQDYPVIIQNFSTTICWILRIICRWTKWAIFLMVPRFMVLPWKNLASFALSKVDIFASMCETITRTCREEMLILHLNAERIATIPVREF